MNPTAQCVYCGTREDDTDSGRAPFFVSIRCAHLICNVDKERIYACSISAECPIEGCHMPLRDEDYHLRTEDEKMVNKEISVRRELAGIYNLSKLDFAATPEYYGYLEEMEDVVYDKTYGGKENKDKVNARITAFKKKHAAQIGANKARLAAAEGDSAEGGNAGEGYAMEGTGVVQVRATAKVEWPAMPEPDTKRLKQNQLEGDELRIFKTREAEAGGYQFEWGKQRNWAQCVELMERSKLYL